MSCVGLRSVEYKQKVLSLGTELCLCSNDVTDWVKMAAVRKTAELKTKVYQQKNKNGRTKHATRAFRSLDIEKEINAPSLSKGRLWYRRQFLICWHPCFVCPNVDWAGPRFQLQVVPVHVTNVFIYVNDLGKKLDLFLFALKGSFHGVAHRWFCWMQLLVTNIGEGVHISMGVHVLDGILQTGKSWSLVRILKLPQSPGGAHGDVLWGQHSSCQRFWTQAFRLVEDGHWTLWTPQLCSGTVDSGTVSSQSAV